MENVTSDQTKNYPIIFWLKPCEQHYALCTHTLTMCRMVQSSEYCMILMCLPEQWNAWLKAMKRKGIIAFLP